MTVDCQKQVTLLKLRTYISIAALLAVGLGAGGYFYWDAHRPWTTNSPKLQNGIELVSIQRVPKDGKPRISTEFNPDALQINSVSYPLELALVRVPDIGKIDKDPGLRPRPGNVAFFLSSKNRVDSCKLHVKEYGARCSVVGVVMPDVCPPAYLDGSLVAKVGEKVLGEWKLSGVRVARKLIPDSAPNLDEVDFGGLKVRAKANYRYYGPGTTSVEISFLADREPVNGDQHEAIVNRTSSSYRAIGGGGALPFNDKGGLAVVLPLETDASSKRVEVSATLIRYRTYDERISVKNVHIEPLPMGEKIPSVFIASFDKEQRFITPSGLKLTVSSWGKPSDFSGSVHFYHSFGIRIKSESGFSSLSLPNSSLHRSTGKPATLSFSCDNWSGGGAMFSPSEDGRTMDLQFQIPYSQNKAQDIADLKLTVRQKAVLEEKTVRFILPIERQRPVAIEGKSPAKPKNRT